MEHTNIEEQQWEGAFEKGTQQLHSQQTERQFTMGKADQCAISQLIVLFLNQISNVTF